MSAQHEPDPDSLFCPKCGSTDVRRSRGEGPRAFFFGLFGKQPFRCRSCRAKFYRQATEHHFHEAEHPQTHHPETQHQQHGKHV